MDRWGNVKTYTGERRKGYLIWTGLICSRLSQRINFFAGENWIYIFISVCLIPQYQLFWTSWLIFIKLNVNVSLRTTSTLYFQTFLYKNDNESFTNEWGGKCQLRNMLLLVIDKCNNNTVAAQNLRLAFSLTALSIEHWKLCMWHCESRDCGDTCSVAVCLRYCLMLGIRSLRL
jgi:hypothetical protein